MYVLFVLLRNLLAQSTLRRCPLDWRILISIQTLHHLFPKLPRYNLRTVQLRVAALAEKHGLTYHLYPFLQANIKTYLAMRETAQQVCVLLSPFCVDYGRDVDAGMLFFRRTGLSVSPPVSQMPAIGLDDGAIGIKRAPDVRVALCRNWQTRRNHHHCFGCGCRERESRRARYRCRLWCDPGSTGMAFVA